MSLRECVCPVPTPRGATANRPNDDERCVKCGLYINPAWTSNDTTVKEFFDRLEGAAPRDPAIAPLRAQAEERELAGRVKFGHRHHGRDNPLDGTEEASDGALYAFFDLLRSRRKGTDEEWALALTAAHHFAKAHHALSLMQAHQHLSLSDADIYKT